jgi:hypothetical protein
MISSPLLRSWMPFLGGICLWVVSRYLRDSYLRRNRPHLLKVEQLIEDIRLPASMAHPALREIHAQVPRWVIWMGRVGGALAYIGAIFVLN